MNYVHHRPIKRFSLEGIIHDDSQIMRLKAEYVRLLWTSMRMSGYVPRLDVDLDFTTSYNEKAQYFEFELSVYGTYLGKRKSEWILGLDGSRAIHTHQIKSSVYSRAAASQ